VTSATQAEFGKLAEVQVSEFNKQVVTALDKMVKTAPAGSEVGIAAFKSGIAAVNSAYDNLSKVAKQFTEATQSNINAVAKQAAEGAKKMKKAA
jgi:peptide deformylase